MPLYTTNIPSNITLGRRRVLKKIIVQKDSYYDSVFLMLINKDVKQFPGVTEAVVSMGTEVNLELLKDMGLYDDEVANATPNDLIIAIEGESEDVLEDAVQEGRRRRRGRVPANQPCCCKAGGA